MVEQGHGSELLSTPEQLWVGNDVRLVNNTIFNPFDPVDAIVECNNEDFPDMFRFSAQQVRRRGMLSVKSQNAQLGLQVDSAASILNALLAFRRAQIQASPTFQFAVPVTNLAGAPIGIEEGRGLARIYMEPTEYVRNGELRNIVGKIKEGKHVEIGGVENVHWKYHLERNKYGELEETGIDLRIKDEDRQYIPLGSEPIFLVGRGRQYRKKLQRILRDATERGNLQEHFLWIGETVPIKLSEFVTAIIDRDAIHSAAPHVPPPLHLESRLIDSGSAWPIRVEVVSPLEGDARADWVTFRICRQAAIAA